MRHRAGSWSFGRTGAGTAGAIPPRPCPRVFAVAAFTLLAHAAGIMLAWQDAPTSRTPPQSRMTVRLVAAQPHRAPLAVSPPAPAPVVTKRRVARAAAAPQPVVVAEASPPPVPVPAEAISGVTFGPPRIGFPGARRTSWMKPPEQAVAAPPPYPDVARLAQAHAAREAGRMQIADALHRQASAWQTPSDAGDGACALPAEPDAHLACDNDALMKTLAPQEAVLSALLKTYRRLDPGASALSIAYAEGRYRLTIVR